MSGRLRLAVILVVGVGVLVLLLAVLAPRLGASEEVATVATHAAMVLVPLCLVALLALLYAHGTSCPACGKVGARTERETACVGREEYDRGGVPWVRSRRRTTYECKYCRHTWSANFTDEYKRPARPAKKRRSLNEGD
jgi:hypothetical protein